MKNITLTILLTIIVVNLVAGAVFLTGNPRPTENSSSEASAQNTIPLENSLIAEEELVQHDSQQDCWIAYKGKVYDLTSFLPKHPGSAAAIAPFCGTSEEFENAFEGMHGTSNVPVLMQEGIYKGELQ